MYAMFIFLSKKPGFFSKKIRFTWIYDNLCQVEVFKDKNLQKHFKKALKRLKKLQIKKILMPDEPFDVSFEFFNEFELIKSDSLDTIMGDKLLIHTLNQLGIDKQKCAVTIYASHMNAFLKNLIKNLSILRQISVILKNDTLNVAQFITEYGIAIVEGEIPENVYENRVIFNLLTEKGPLFQIKNSEKKSFYFKSAEYYINNEALEKIPKSLHNSYISALLKDVIIQRENVKIREIKII